MNSPAMNAQTEMTEAQRQFDNKLLRLIQQHFPSIPLHGEEADKNWTRWLNFARDCAHLTKPDAGGGEAELAAALEQQRALKIVSDVRAQGFAKSSTTLPTQAESLFDLACEEIEHRLRTEQWALNGVATPLPSSEHKCQTCNGHGAIGRAPDDYFDCPDCTPCQPSVVPMPEPCPQVNQLGWIRYTEESVKTYADARVSEATRELVDGLRHALAAAVNAQNILMRDMPNHNWHGWLEKDIGEARNTLSKYTQTQKESK